MAFVAEVSHPPERMPEAEPITIMGSSARAAAQSARRAFFTPIAADLFADLDLCETAHARQVRRYPAEFADVLGEPHSGGWMYCGALENFPERIACWSALRPLYGNPADTVRRVRDPWQVATCLTQAGIACPELASNGVQLPRTGIWLRKPLQSAGGQAVALLHENLPPAERAVYYQQCISGPSYSASYVAAGGAVRLLGVTRQLLVPRSYRYCGSIGPIEVQPGVWEQFERIGLALAGQFSLVGLFGVDAIVSDRQVWPVEVNPRYTASMEVLERAIGFSAVAWHVMACREGHLPHIPQAKGEPVFGKQIVFAEADGVVRSDLRDHLSEIADVPRPGTILSPGAPVLTVLRSGPTVEAVAQTLAAAVTIASEVIRRC